METGELPLFSLNNQPSASVSNRITEEKIISPVLEVLDTAATPTKEPKSIKKSLNDLFPEQAYEEKQVKRATEILGALGDEFTTEELRDVVAELQFLVSTWLDDFERGIFDGLTLKELLHEKGGA